MSRRNLGRSLGMAVPGSSYGGRIGDEVVKDSPRWNSERFLL